MGKKREQGRGIVDQKKEKPIFGSGADVRQMLEGDGFVKCVCTVACAWKGYHDEGDKVFIKRELIEKDAFIRAHFKEVKSEELRVKSSDSGEGDGHGGGERGEGDGQGDGQGEGEGQGELGLK